MAQILLNLSQQVHPLVLGEVFRTRSQIRMLATKLIANQVKGKDSVNKILEFMCSESGSHDYTINRREAKEELGLNITKPDKDQYLVIKQLYDDFSEELELTNKFESQRYLGIDNEKDYSFRRGLIESVGYGSHVFLSEGKFQKRTIPGQSTEQMLQISTKEGWEYECAKQS